MLKVLFTFLLMTNVLRAVSPDKAFEAKENLRILELLPNLLRTFAVEPAIPSDFVAMDSYNKRYLDGWTYWGPKDVLEDYFKNPDSLKRAVLRVQVSNNLSQIGDKIGDKSFDAWIQMMEKENPNTFSIIEHRWGDYPVKVLKYETEGQGLFFACVGLNDKKGGHVLIFNLVYPENKQLSSEDKQLWDRLIMDTKGLTNGDFFRANGQDLQPGYTIVKRANVKLKMTAEKRKRDGAIQVVMVPLTPTTEFLFQDMEIGSMNAEWNFGKPMVGVLGTLQDKTLISLGYVVTIFLEEVEDFSVNKDGLPKNTNYHVYQKLLE